LLFASPPLSMSDQQFNDVFGAFLGKVASYSDAQRGDLLQATKQGLDAALGLVGEPKSPSAANGDAAASGKSESVAAGKSDSVAAGRLSVKVAQAPGGNSTVFLGDEKQAGPTSGRKLFSGKNESSLVLGDDSGSRPNTSVRVAQAPGGNSTVSFGDDNVPTAGHKRAPSNDSSRNTSVRVAQAPGGTSQIQLGSESGDKKSVGSGAGQVVYNVRSEISTAIYRKGKLKDTFTKFTGNRTKTLSSDDLRTGIASLGIQISAAQALSLTQEYSKDPAGITYSDFVRMLTV